MKEKSALQGRRLKYTTVPNAVIAGLPGLKVIETGVLLYIMHRYPSPYALVEEMAETLGVGARSILRALRVLHERGYIRSQKNGRKAAYDFQPLLDKLVGDELGDSGAESWNEGEGEPHSAELTDSEVAGVQAFEERLAKPASIPAAGYLTLPKTELQRRCSEVRLQAAPLYYPGLAEPTCEDALREAIQEVYAMQVYVEEPPDHDRAWQLIAERYAEYVRRRAAEVDYDSGAERERLLAAWRRYTDSTGADKTLLGFAQEFYSQHQHREYDGEQP